MTEGYPTTGSNAEGYQSYPPYPFPPPDAPYGLYYLYPSQLMGPGYPYYYYPAPVAPTTNSFAIVSLILSICGVVMPGLVVSILGVIFGHIAQSQIKRASVPEKGSGLATASLCSC